MAPAAGELTRFAIGIGTSASDRLDIGIPVLGGVSPGHVFPGAQSVGRRGTFRLGEADEWQVGMAAVPINDNLEAATEQLYDEMFAALGRRQLVRCWNYVPAINQVDSAGLENYQRFCRARSLAFEKCFGADFATFLPAASAVGGPDSQLAVIFAATSGRARHLENPVQVPAYAYPKEYGPRSPSFSRATIAETQKHTMVFVSGTAAIRGHATVSPGDTSRQLSCTLENLAEISRACGLGPDLAGRSAPRRQFTVYLRSEADYAGVRQRLQQELLRPGDVVSYLNAPICRSGLNVEIEATITTR